jgi:hypothetical protein
MWAHRSCTEYATELGAGFNTAPVLADYAINLRAVLTTRSALGR